jgi:hypothetical protein
MFNGGIIARILQKVYWNTTAAKYPFRNAHSNKRDSEYIIEGHLRESHHVGFRDICLVFIEMREI